MMRKFFIFLVLVFVSHIAATQFVLIEFRPLPADFHAERNTVFDMDMEYCAAIKVECDVPSNLNLKQKVYKRENIESGVYYFFVSNKEKNITFTAPGYESLTVNVPEDGLQRAVTYYIKLDSETDVVATFNISPQPDRVIINDKIISKSKVQIAPGQYRLQIEKDGFEPVDEQIEISTENKIFNYKLSRLAQDKIVEKIVEVPVEIQPRPNEPTLMSISRFDLIFDVLSCELYDDQLIINLTITNNAFDRDVKILGWGNNFCRIIDDSGNEYKPSQFNFSNKSYHADIKATLVQGIPTSASLVFKEVNRNMSSLALFDLGIWTEENNDFRINFRNVPLQKK